MYISLHLFPNSVKKHLENFEQYLKNASKSVNTIKSYMSDLHNLVRDFSIDETIDQSKVDTIYRSLKNDYGYSRQTISRKLNSLKSFLEFLSSSNVIQMLPEVDFHGTTVSLTKQNFLKRQDILRLREVVREDIVLKTIIEIALQTGMIISEIAALNLKDIVLTDLHSRIVVKENKREISMNDKLKFNLFEYLNYRDRYIIPLFYTSTGNRIHVRNLRNYIKDALKEINEVYTVNDLRNTFIVNQLDAGLPIDRIQKFVGHKNSITTKRYIDLLDKPYKESGIQNIVEV